MVQEGSKRDILGETPGFPGVSRDHIRLGRISFWPDRHRHGHRTNTKNIELLYNSPFGAKNGVTFVSCPTCRLYITPCTADGRGAKRDIY